MRIIFFILDFPNYNLMVFPRKKTQRGKEGGESWCQTFKRKVYCVETVKQMVARVIKEYSQQQGRVFFCNIWDLLSKHWNWNLPVCNSLCKIFSSISYKLLLESSQNPPPQQLNNKCNHPFIAKTQNGQSGTFILIFIKKTNKMHLHKEKFLSKWRRKFSMWAMNSWLNAWQCVTQAPLPQAGWSYSFPTSILTKSLRTDS